MVEVHKIHASTLTIFYECSNRSSKKVFVLEFFLLKKNPKFFYKKTIN